jgi:hypothetical protein
LQGNYTHHCHNSLREKNPTNTKNTTLKHSSKAATVKQVETETPQLKKPTQNRNNTLDLKFFQSREFSFYLGFIEDLGILIFVFIRRLI